MLCFFMFSNSFYYKEKAGKKDDKAGVFLMLDIPETTFWSLPFLQGTKFRGSLETEDSFGVVYN